MAPNISRLRRWFAVAAIAAALVVAGEYFYARHKVQNVLKQVPGKIAQGIQQSAEGFTISGSDGGRTTFKIQASKAVQFQHGHAELHDVAITLYGRDSARYDQIYGSDFEYDPKSGDVIAKGEVEIDLEANPAGLASPDQTVPKVLKNPIHLKTSGLTFNQKTGNAVTQQAVEFHVAQASGSAKGVSYDGKSGLLTLQSQVALSFAGPTAATITAARGVVLKNPRIIVLDQVHLQSGTRIAEAGNAMLFLRPNNDLDRVLARGNVQVDSGDGKQARVLADELEIRMASQRGLVQDAIFSGNVRVEGGEPQPVKGSAERFILNFAGNNVLASARAEGNVHLRQPKKLASPSSGEQDVELSAAAVNFILGRDRHLKDAETSGPAQIAIIPAVATNGQTVVTAGKFEARFDALGRLTSVHGAPDAHIVSSNPGQPDRVSTSDSLDASFRPGQGMDAIVQQGNLVYSDGARKAWADRARYTPADQMLVLSGSPRVVEGGMTTTARVMRLDRTTGDAFAEGEVKTTYSDLKPQPGGAMLASSNPIHVTAATMTAHSSSAVALYAGGVRLWQDANVVSAPTIRFDRDRRSVVAGTAAGQSVAPGSQPVSTVLVQTDKNGKVIPVTITANHLTYSDEERQAHFEGDVVARAADFTVSAGQMEALLQARGQSGEGVAKLDKIVAQGQVEVTQTTRRANGERLIYTVADDKFVLTGGPPSIFDAEQGKITGVSLTLFRTDDRVLVEGNESSPSVTQTRVAR